MKRQSLDLGSPLFFLGGPITMNLDRSPTEETRTRSAKSQTGRKSQSIPLPSSHVHRTQSEVQLCEDMETAERRDLNMFYRLVNGIRERQGKLAREHHHMSSDLSRVDVSSTGSGTVDQHYSGPHRPQQHLALHAMETEWSLAHIIQTRNAPMESASRFPVDYDIASRLDVAQQLQPNNDGSHHNGAMGMPLKQTPLYGPMQPRGGATAALLAAAEEDWSVSGFDQDPNGVSVTVNPINGYINRSSFQQVPRSTNAPAATSHFYYNPSSTVPATPQEADDGIFELDL